MLTAFSGVSRLKKIPFLVVQGEDVPYCMKHQGAKRQDYQLLVCGILGTEEVLSFSEIADTACYQGKDTRPDTPRSELQSIYSLTEVWPLEHLC